MNSYGNLLRISIFGESHGPVVGIHIDGVPPGLPLEIEHFIQDLGRRKSGSKGTTARKESDLPEILCGVLDGVTTGAPVVVVFKNGSFNSDDYEQFREVPRPGHADLVSSVKYNFYNDIRGGGMFSGRMTLPLVAAGVVAKKIISPIEISARVVEAGGVKIEGDDPTGNKAFASLLDGAIKDGDSLGGIVECVCKNVPIGLGEPFFDSMESQISHLVFSIPGVRGIEFGDGFAASKMRGSQHNDCYVNSKGQTATNGAGGINGGITNGNPIVFRVAIKPTSSIAKRQTTYNFISEKMEDLSISGRHDACFALRVPVVVESVVAIVLSSNILQNYLCSQEG
jgi:chorismate synthase